MNQILDLRPVHVYINSATSRLSAWQKRSCSRLLPFVESLPAIHYPHQREISPSVAPPLPRIFFHSGDFSSAPRSFSCSFPRRCYPRRCVIDKNISRSRRIPRLDFCRDVRSRRRIRARDTTNPGILRESPSRVTFQLLSFRFHARSLDTSSTRRTASRAPVLIHYRVIDFSIACCSRAFSPFIVPVYFLPRDL